MDNSKIIPYKGSVINLSEECRIYIKGGDIEIGTDKLKKSNIETLLRMRGASIWSNSGGCKISYGSTIEILNNAILDTKYFTMNSRSVIVSAIKIIIGKDVMIGRNVILYDSDFHYIKNDSNVIMNKPKEIMIDDHSWITSNVTILKGSRIGKNCIVSSGTVYRGNTDNNTIISNEQNLFKRNNYGTWYR